MREIAMWISGAKHYYIQSYTDSPEVIEKRFSAYDAKMLEHFADVCREFVPNVCLRGVSKLS
jgi:pyruvate formate lyase activating enzyme